MQTLVLRRILSHHSNAKMYLYPLILIAVSLAQLGAAPYQKLSASDILAANGPANFANYQAQYDPANKFTLKTATKWKESQKSL